MPKTLFRGDGVGWGYRENSFDDIDLFEEPDWVSYDEKNDCCVGVYDFKSDIIVAVHNNYYSKNQIKQRSKLRPKSFFHSDKYNQLLNKYAL